jgi:hypothetical protein
LILDGEGYSHQETLLVELESIVDIDWVRDYFDLMVLISNLNPLRNKPTSEGFLLDLVYHLILFDSIPLVGLGTDLLMTFHHLF